MKQFKLDHSPIVYYVNKNENKEWILFLHAAFVNHHMFKTQIEYFKNRYNIVAIDIIGHGNSINTKRGDSINKMSVWTNEIMNKENIDKIHIVGVSLGAVLAQDFANHYPHKVSSLACFGGYDINNFDTAMQKENGASHMFMMLKALVSVKWFAEANKKISAYVKEAQEEFYDMNTQFPKKSFMYLSSLNSMVNAHQTAKRMYPLLIGCGKNDIPMELSAVNMWANNEPDCVVTIFEHAGHCVNMDVPQEFNARMEKFWNNGK